MAKLNLNIDMSKLKVGDLLKGFKGFKGLQGAAGAFRADLARGYTFGVLRNSGGGMADGQQFKTKGEQGKRADGQLDKEHAEKFPRRGSG